MVTGGGVTTGFVGVGDGTGSPDFEQELRNSTKAINKYMDLIFCK